MSDLGRAVTGAFKLMMWVAGLACFGCMVLLLMLIDQAWGDDLEWEPSNSHAGVWKLVGTKIRHPVADGPPYPDALRLCFKAPKDASHEPCHVDDDRTAHAFVPMTATGYEQWDLGKLAYALDAEVTIHVDENSTAPNNNGVLRCQVVRVVPLKH